MRTSRLGMAFREEGKATNQRGSLGHKYQPENLSKLLDFDIQESHGQVVNGIAVERWRSGWGRKSKRLPWTAPNTQEIEILRPEVTLLTRSKLHPRWVLVSSNLPICTSSNATSLSTARIKHGVTERPRRRHPYYHTRACRDDGQSHNLTVRDRGEAR